MKIISTYYSKNEYGARADVVESEGEFFINYYDAGCNFVCSESYSDTPLKIVEDQAEDWSLRIDDLYG